MISKLITAVLTIFAIVFTAWYFLWGAGGGRPELNTGSDLPPHTHSDVTHESPTPEASGSEDDASSWNRFRGPNGNGTSNDPNIPTSWSESENLGWKTELPGAGASSPVLTPTHVFVTSYSGYGVPNLSGGSTKDLKRHLSCIDRTDGKILWTQTIDNEVKEDPYQGMGVPEHGYATNTPVTDGDSVFVFYGKSGVIAYDLQGNERWRKSVGTGSSNRQWGSAASLLLYQNMLIVNGAEESQTLYAFDSKTGDQIWKSEAPSLELCFSTPSIATDADGNDSIVVAVPGEIWGLSPKNGKLDWYVTTSLTGNLSPSPIVVDDKVYVFGGYRSKGSVAIKVGGSGDVTKSNTIWTSRCTSYVPTPVLHDGRFYWIDNKGVYYCASEKDGAELFQKRAPIRSGGGQPVYASPVAINGMIYMQTRNDGVFVVEPSEDDMKIVSHNQFDSDKSQFNATPAVDNGQLFLRSDKYLYCVKK